MPTYQYSCTDCGHFFEAVQSFSDDSLTVCPECEGRLRKVFNAVGVVFKGSGFYRTDSRSESGHKNGHASSEKSPSKDGAKSESSGTSSTSDSSSGSSGSSSASSPTPTPA
ncbi:FmdB family zinc ribbon protein [Marmoricola sp. URHB0036]|uniref:FmdB family zinc ribbon protein n=1 Tax=Marmoricola sp. URHB0036 TaxID=1298863 RepID=UPI0004893B73|nr:FmdB family zinc ribbon protein [Marmoricola sp. URHB0036]